MSGYYKTYQWKNGKPIGLNREERPSGLVYKIVTDPYYKRISIEEYQEGCFSKTIYDSVLLDFRSLKQNNYLAWERQWNSNQEQSLIRDENDRVVYLETYKFHEQRCLECHIFYPNKTLLSIQKIFYKGINSLSFNGVILFDAIMQPVMLKEYEINHENGEFGNLVKEEWQNLNRVIEHSHLEV
ncbi:MAG: hypothetical protein ACSNEK_07850 [Parachlamydiaceae bacterium]